LPGAADVVGVGIVPASPALSVRPGNPEFFAVVAIIHAITFFSFFFALTSLLYRWQFRAFL
jgi:hypothetical protein